MTVYTDMCKVDALLLSPIGGRGGRYCLVLRKSWLRPEEDVRLREYAMLDCL